MFTQDHMKVTINDVTVQDALTMLQLIRRFLKSGVMEDLELAPVSELRGKLVKAVEGATNVNYDVAFAQAMQQMGSAAMPAPRGQAPAKPGNGAS